MKRIFLSIVIFSLLIACRDSMSGSDDPLSSDNHLLSDLSVSEGELVPAFSPSIHEYNVELTTDNTSISINATADQGTSITINGSMTGTQTVSLYPDTNIVDIIVSSEDGENSSEYNININCSRYLRDPNRYQLDTSLNQNYGHICKNSNGDEVSISSFDRDLYAMHYIEGSGYGQLIKIGTDLYDPTDFGTAIDSDGNILVVFVHEDSSSSPEIAFVTYTPGTGWSTQSIISPSNENVSSFNLILGEDETPIVTLYTNVSGSNNRLLSSSYSFSSGWTSFVTVDSNINNFGNMKLIQAGNQYYVFWKNHNNINPVAGENGIYYSVRNIHSGWSDPIHLYHNNIENYFISADGNSAGDICITFHESSSTVSGFTTKAIYNSNGNGWSDPIEVSNAVVGGGRASVAIDEIGNAIVIYIGDGLDQEIWSNKYTPGGGWSGSSRIWSIGATDLQVVSVAKSVFILVFSQYIPSTPNQIYYSIFDLQNGWGDFEPISKTAFYLTNGAVVTKTEYGDTVVSFHGQENSSSKILLYSRWYR